MVTTATSLARCLDRAGVSARITAAGADLDGRPVQCLELPAAMVEPLRLALQAQPGVEDCLLVDVATPEGHVWVLERGRDIDAGWAALGLDELEELGGQAAGWQARHPAERLPETAGGYRRGVLQQLTRERAAVLADTLDPSAREILQAELHHQGLYRFEDLPLAGSYWRSVRACSGGIGLADLTLPPAPVPAFWQLARVVLAVAADGRGVLDIERYRAVLTGYHRRRPLRAIERGGAPTLLRLAALDDWLSALEQGATGESEQQRLRGLQEQVPRLQGVWVPVAA